MESKKDIWSLMDLELLQMQKELLNITERLIKILLIIKITQLIANNSLAYWKKVGGWGGGAIEETAIFKSMVLIATLLCYAHFSRKS